ncbi:DUF4179 domain-containing protein [Bacillus sp. REN16]|uniref:DUF4179 domain-containing protein n=1 Tax=Bacillus sp. REN16 TaxID=2887296 RepID=UPI001E401E60|nr:DUF4179 domain-containing protein [Bacillus sp. REN16]MCC3357237.1 DUF4179 domain-containing protein [Bacillus sp. REN16]
MIIAETDPVIIKMIREKDMGAIVNWFDIRKDSFYKLAWTYLENVTDIQDVLYDVIIKVQSNIRKQRKDVELEKWVIFLIMEECKKKRLKEDLDDALILTYVQGYSQQDVAEILEISVESVRNQLYKGIQRLTGFKEGHHQEKFIDYLSRTLDRLEKIEFEIHLHTCQACQNGLAAIQDTIFTLIDDVKTIEVQEDFFNDVITRLKRIDEVKRKKKKKRTTIGIGIASSLFLLLLIGYATNAFSYVYYSWLDWQGKEDEQLIAYLKSGIGEPLNLVQENNGVKVTIKSAIADDYQTLIYYEVESIEQEEHYGINFWNGVSIENEGEILENLSYPINQLPVQPVKSGENVVKGTFSLLPIKKEDETIKLNISKLQKVGRSASIDDWLDPYDESTFIRGTWKFEIPVIKQPSIEHTLVEKATIDGIPFEFKKLIFAPTVTLLKYTTESGNNKKFIHEINIAEIETEKKTVKPDPFSGNVQLFETGDGISFLTRFDSLYFENAKEFSIHFSSFSYYVSDSFQVDIDMTQPFPQTFEYLGSDISVDKVELGMPTKIEITAPMHEGRKFESIHFNIVSPNNTSAMSMGITDIQGVLVDRKGKIYNRDEYSFNANMDVIDRPRHYETKVLIEIHNDVSEEEIIPGWLQIQGYQGTTYLDEVINLEIK